MKISKIILVFASVLSLISYVSAQDRGGSQAVSAGTSTETAVQITNTNLLNQFSPVEYLLVFLCFLMMLVIWVLVIVIRSLSVQLSDKTKA
jgi:hypothetical protein